MRVLQLFQGLFVIVLLIMAILVSAHIVSTTYRSLDFTTLRTPYVAEKEQATTCEPQELRSATSPPRQGYEQPDEDTWP